MKGSIELQLNIKSERREELMGRQGRAFFLLQTLNPLVNLQTWSDTSHDNAVQNYFIKGVCVSFFIKKMRGRENKFVYFT